jgi:predicted GIY-YIG superfamily endonuclease
MAWVYILKCSDDSYYTGSTIDLEKRMAEHMAGNFDGYTSNRLRKNPNALSLPPLLSQG